MSHPVNLHRPRYGHDLIGQRFGRLEVFAQAPSARYTRWRCRCDCGTEVVVSRQLLIMGEKGTRSCGCLRDEQRRRNCWAAGRANAARWRKEPAQSFDASGLLAVFGAKP